MTNEQIIQWAREAGAELNVFARMRVGGVLFAEYELARFAELVAAATREECAKVCEQEACGGSAFNSAANYMAGRIRAMKKGTTA